MNPDKTHNAAIEAKVESIMLKLSSRVDEIKSYIKDKEGDVRLHGEQTIRTLEGQRDALEDRIAEMKDAGGDALEDVKESIKLSLQAIEDGVEKSYKSFHKEQ